MKKFLVLLTLLVFVTYWVPGCNSPSTPSSYEKEAKDTEENQQRLIRAVPPPKLQTSLERKNIARRLERINRENVTSYIYLINYGKVMAYYVISGKPSSLNSFMTPMEQLVERPGGAQTRQWMTLEAPDQDGSYGKNVEGVFFFTTEGVYVEWKGDYLWCDQPLKISQPPELIQVVEEKKLSVEKPEKTK